MAHAFSFGIEEEYFLVDAGTKLPADEMPKDFLDRAKTATGGRAAGEFLQSQVEVMTAPSADMASARQELRDLRAAVAAVAADYGLAILAAGTHPTAVWSKSRHTATERYDTIMDDLQMLGRRYMMCGLHVHVELPDADARVDVMARMIPYIPLFAALATSSPFWQSQPTGLRSYRLAAHDELPRSGLPEIFRTEKEFDAYVQALRSAGVADDQTYVRWALRPSVRHPTLELRAPDCCTLVDDSIAIAALYRAVARRLYRDPSLNGDINSVTRAIADENKWRAQRHGVRGTFVKADGSGAVTVAEMLEQVLADVLPDAEELGCTAQVARCRAIVGDGTSADAQIAVFEAYARKSESREHALHAVTEWLASATLQ